jgi:hypothetical protein
LNTPRSGSSRSVGLLDDQSSWARIALRSAALIAASIVAWFPLGLPYHLLRALLVSSRCSITPLLHAARSSCLTEVRIRALLPTMIIFMILVLARRPIFRLIGRRPDTPLTSAIVSIIALEVFWAGSHFNDPLHPGALPPLFFPAACALGCYLALLYGSRLMPAAEQIQLRLLGRSQPMSIGLITTALGVFYLVVIVLLKSAIFIPGSLLFEELAIVLFLTLMSLEIGLLASEPAFMAMWRNVLRP